MLHLCRFGCAVLLIATISSPCRAEPEPPTAAGTGCSEQFLETGFFIEDGKRVFDDDKFQAFTMQLDTVVYKDSSGVDRAGKTLGFDQRVLISDPGRGTARLGVRSLSDESLGWVERDDLLCRVFPLSDSATGLLQRVVIQTETSVQNEVVPRTAYHSPDGKCEGGDASCPKLSRFQWYFVYGERNGKLLLSESANLGGREAHLVGWLPEQDGIKWNTAVALRPSEALEGRKAPDGSEAHVCAYPSADVMSDPKACRPVLGGLRWFKIDTRLPILKDLGNAYEVAISSAATSGTFEQALSLARIDALKNVDVFFVIDGTKSMQGVIEAIKGRPGYPGVVDQIRARIKGKMRQGGTVRYGYRIYRDSIKGGKSGVEDDGFPLADTCSANEEAFLASFAKVSAVDPVDDRDYSENVFGGLVQASRDFSTCPDHLKLVVVIGDHGYDAAAQRARGHTAYDFETVTERYIKGRRVNTQPVVVFIQTTSVASDATSAELYDKSYAAFRDQAVEILNRVYKPLQSQGIAAGLNPESFFFRLPTKDADFAFVEGIINQVDQLLQPDVISKLATRLSSGESLTEVITSLQKGDRTNVPVLYWNVVADALCKRLGDQCNKKVLEGVFRAYIPRSDDLVHDVLLSQSQLDAWREMLGKFKTFWSQLRSGERSRSQLVNVLMESIGSVLKIVIDDSGKSMGEIVQMVGGLPYGAESKLMSYKPEELRKEDMTKPCEIQHLVNYASKKSDIIQIALDGDKLAVFDAETLPTSACPELSTKGQAVPHLPGAPRPRALNAADGTTDYRLNFRKGNDLYYWIPVSYLP